MRQAVAVMAGAAAAVLGGLIVGEYPFTGAMPYVAGVLFGLVIAEIVVAIAGHGSRLLGTLCAVMAGAGIALAVWDDAGYGIRPIGAPAWMAVAIAFVVAGLRGGWLPSRPGDRRGTAESSAPGDDEYPAVLSDGDEGE